MKLIVAKPEDRDAVSVIMARNGYTVRQGKEKPAGAKAAVNFVEVIDGTVINGGEYHDVVSAAKIETLEKRMAAAEAWISSQPTVESVAQGVRDRLLKCSPVRTDANPPAGSTHDTVAED